LLKTITMIYILLFGIVLLMLAYAKLSNLKAAIININRAIKKQEKLQPKSLEDLFGLIAFLVIMFFALLPWFD
jgi:ABC-type Fe3+ transport system permease subunit